MAFTVLDVLSYLDTIPVCVGYEIDGEVTNIFPTTDKLNRAKPVLEYLEGWKTDIRGIRKYEDLDVYKRQERSRRVVLSIFSSLGF